MTLHPWQSHLVAQHIPLNTRHADDHASHLYDLSPLSGLWVQGRDARQFLQGQVTCDIAQLTPEHSLIGAHCNTKGRVLFSFRAIDLSEVNSEPRILLVMPQSMVETATALLKKYIVFSKATLSTENTPAMLGLSGKTLDQALDLPTTTNEVACIESRYFISISANRWLCLLSPDTFANTWAEWAPRYPPSHFALWQLANIRDGLGEVWPGAEDEFIPQMLNFDVIGAISFKKGCYIGQEVVARMQYRGKLKRHMQRVAGTGETPSPGMPVFGESSEQSIGNVVIASPTRVAPTSNLSKEATSKGADTFEALIVITDSAFSSEQLFLSQERSAKLEALLLPYAINN